MLDLRLVWDDGPPIFLFSSSGIKDLPIVSEEELKVLIAAIKDFTVTGKLWSYTEWRDALDKDFEILGDSIRRDHPQTIEEEEAEEEESEMLHTSRKGQEEQNIPREGMAKEVTLLMPGMGQAIAGESLLPNPTDDECNTPSGRTRQVKRAHFEGPSDSIDGSAAAMTQDATNTPSGSESSIDDAATTRNGSEEMSQNEAKDILLNHPLPKARQRTNTVSDDYIPEGSEHSLLGARVSLKLLFVFLLP